MGWQQTWEWVCSKGLPSQTVVAHIMISEKEYIFLVFVIATPYKENKL